MRRVWAAGRHLLGLFVDDGGFAAAIVAWMAVVAVGCLWLGLEAVWRGPVLFAGLAVLLGWACLRHQARRRG